MKKTPFNWNRFTDGEIAYSDDGTEYAFYSTHVVLPDLFTMYVTALEKKTLVTYHIQLFKEAKAPYLHHLVNE